MSTRTGGLQLTHPWCVSWRAARSWPIRISLRRVWNSSAACSRYLHYSVSITFVWSVCFVCTIVHAYLLTFFSEKILWCIDTGLFLSLVQPDIKMIKRRIEDLITREYLEHDVDAANSYQYLAWLVDADWLLQASRQCFHLYIFWIWIA